MVEEEVSAIERLGDERQVAARSKKGGGRRAWQESRANRSRLTRAASSEQCARSRCVKPQVKHQARDL